MKQKNIPWIIWLSSITNIFAQNWVAILNGVCVFLYFVHRHSICYININILYITVTCKESKITMMMLKIFSRNLQPPFRITSLTLASSSLDPHSKNKLTMSRSRANTRANAPSPGSYIYVPGNNGVVVQRKVVHKKNFRQRPVVGRLLSFHATSRFVSRALKEYHSSSTTPTTPSATPSFYPVGQRRP